MLASVVLLLLLPVVHATQMAIIPPSPSKFPECALIGEKPQWPTMKLTQCFEYHDIACCTKRETERLRVLFKKQIAAFNHGCPGCVANLQKLWCAFLCHPRQGDFVSVTESHDDGSWKSATMAICDNFCNRFYASCRGMTVKGKGLVADIWKNANEFCVGQGSLIGDNGVKITVRAAKCFDGKNAETDLELDKCELPRQKAECPLSNRIAQQPSEPLESCPHYHKVGDICCTPAETGHIQALLDKHRVTERFAFCPNCVTNLRALRCGFQCNVKQSQFVNVTAWTGLESDQPRWKSAQFALCTSFCERLYKSCSKVTLEDELVTDTWSSATEFCLAQNHNPDAIDMIVRDHDCLDDLKVMPTCHPPAELFPNPVMKAHADLDTSDSAGSGSGDLPDANFRLDDSNPLLHPYKRKVVKSSTLADDSNSSTSGEVLHPSCPVTRRMAAVPNPPLTACETYQTGACCTHRDTDKLLKHPSLSPSGRFAGCPGCLHNLRAFACAFTCDPHQSRFVDSIAHLPPEIDEDNDTPSVIAKKKAMKTTYTFTFRVCLSFCQKMSASCGTVVMGDGQSVSDMFSEPADFCNEQNHAPDIVTLQLVSSAEQAKGVTCFGDAIEKTPTTCAAPKIPGSLMASEGLPRPVDKKREEAIKSTPEARLKAARDIAARRHDNFEDLERRR